MFFICASVSCSFLSCFLVSVVLLSSTLERTTPLFPAIQLLFKSGVLICGCPLERFCFFPPKPFCQISFSLSCFVFHYFSSVFPLKTPSLLFLPSSTPFEITFAFCFFCSSFVAPFLSSFLLLSFKKIS